MIPLIIADKNRNGAAFEITMAGTIMAVTQLAYYFCQIAVTAIVEIFLSVQDKNHLIIIRSFVIFLLIASTYFAFIDAKLEWINLRRQCKTKSFCRKKR